MLRANEREPVIGQKVLFLVLLLGKILLLLFGLLVLCALLSNVLGSIREDLLFIMYFFIINWSCETSRINLFTLRTYKRDMLKIILKLLLLFLWCLWFCAKNIYLEDSDNNREVNPHTLYYLTQIHCIWWEMLFWFFLICNNIWERIHRKLRTRYR